FRPSGGLGHGQQQRPDRDATQARAEAVGSPPAQEKVFDQRHTHEIERDENIAAGLPPEGVPAETTEQKADAKRNFREPNLQTPAEVKEEEKFAPVQVTDQPRGIIDSIRTAPTNLVTNAQRLNKPVKPR